MPQFNVEFSLNIKRIILTLLHLFKAIGNERHLRRVFHQCMCLEMVFTIQCIQCIPQIQC